MSLLPSLPGLHQGSGALAAPLVLDKALPSAGALLSGGAARARGTARLRTFEISSHYHCSIVGTCLTAGELRQVMVKGGDEAARQASDHALHSRGVWLAGQRSVQGKLLNKALDRKHEGLIRQVSRLSTPEELRAFWRTAFDRGDISGAYWAVLSHPDTDERLMRDVFGEVHMLSHLVGSASRLDIARLTKLQADLDAQAEVIARQERRLSEAAEERAALVRENDRLQIALAKAQAAASAGYSGHHAPCVSTPEAKADHIAEGAAAGAADGPRAGMHLTESSVEVERLEMRLAAARVEIETLQTRASLAERQAEELQRENDLAERLLGGGEGDRMVTGSVLSAGHRHAGCCGSSGAVLYVGGRRNLYDRLRAIAADQGVTLLLHDGGMEDSTTLLPAVLAQAETVIFPVDHISHTATGIIKRACRESGKRYHPLRSAGLTSFIAALGSAHGGHSADASQLA
jgi:hypothetical protein